MNWFLYFIKKPTITTCRWFLKYLILDYASAICSIRSIICYPAVKNSLPAADYSIGLFDPVEIPGKKYEKHSFKPLIPGKELRFIHRLQKVNYP